MESAMTEYQDQKIKREDEVRRDEQRHELFKQFLKHSMDFADKALFSLLLINGSAAITLLAKDNELWATMTLAIGAFFAVLGMACVCFYNYNSLLVHGSNKHGKEDPVPKFFSKIFFPHLYKRKKDLISMDVLKSLYWYAAGLGFFSLVCFVIGLLFVAISYIF